MGIELLRKAIQDQSEKVVRQEDIQSELKPLTPKEIKRGIRGIYGDLGVLMELLDSSLGTTSFEVERPNFSVSGLPEAVIDFFETQYELMPEDITFGIKAIQDSCDNHNLYLELSRRGRSVSSVSFCSYVRSRGEMACHLSISLNHEELQPMSTIETQQKIRNLKYSGNDLVNDTFDLQTSRAIFDFAVNGAVRHIELQTQEAR